MSRRESSSTIARGGRTYKYNTRARGTEHIGARRLRERRRREWERGRERREGAGNRRIGACSRASNAVLSLLAHARERREASRLAVRYTHSCSRSLSGRHLNAALSLSRVHTPRRAPAAAWKRAGYAEFIRAREYGKEFCAAEEELSQARCGWARGTGWWLISPVNGWRRMWWCSRVTPHELHAVVLFTRRTRRLVSFRLFFLFPFHSAWFFLCVYTGTMPSFHDKSLRLWNLATGNY